MISGILIGALSILLLAGIAVAGVWVSNVRKGIASLNGRFDLLLTQIPSEEKYKALNERVVHLEIAASERPTEKPKSAEDEDPLAGRTSWAAIRGRIEAREAELAEQEKHFVRV